MSSHLTRIDELLLGEYRFLEPDDECFFISEYTARKGFSHSETNNKIYNLKMKPSVRRENPLRWRHKGLAINYWASKLKSVFPAVQASQYFWIPIPGSKPEDHDDYDDRLVRVIRRAYGSSVDILPLFSQPCFREAAHDTGDRPTPQTHREQWKIADFPVDVDARRFVIFDDIIARGASFRAASDLVFEYYPDSEILGIFLARNVHEDPELDLTGLFD